jgi:hypothetical protein
LAARFGLLRYVWFGTRHCSCSQST